MEKETYTVNVTHEVEVTIDRSKFTQEFLDEYLKIIGGEVDIKDHVKNLARLHIDANIDQSTFLEGYGKTSEMGIQCKTLRSEIYTI